MSGMVYACCNISLTLLYSYNQRVLDSSQPLHQLIQDMTLVDFKVLLCNGPLISKMNPIL